MLLYALLPLLALPGALAGPLRQRSPVKRETPIREGKNPLRFVDTVPEDGKNRYEPRLAQTYSNDKCENPNTSLGDGYDMEDRSCIKDPSIRSFWPGELSSRSGTFCLLKYKDDDCHCIESSQLFKIDQGEPQNCISVDGDYRSYSWERTYDFMPKCPTGCYNKEDYLEGQWANGLPTPQ